jgi:hypothetical protein
MFSKIRTEDTTAWHVHTDATVKINTAIKIESDFVVNTDRVKMIRLYKLPVPVHIFIKYQ